MWACAYVVQLCSCLPRSGACERTVVCSVPRVRTYVRSSAPRVARSLARAAEFFCGLQWVRGHFLRKTVASAYCSVQVVISCTSGWLAATREHKMHRGALFMKAGTPQGAWLNGAVKLPCVHVLRASFPAQRRKTGCHISTVRSPRPEALRCKRASCLSTMASNFRKNGLVSCTGIRQVCPSLTETSWTNCRPCPPQTARPCISLEGAA